MMLSSLDYGEHPFEMIMLELDYIRRNLLEKKRH